MFPIFHSWGKTIQYGNPNHRLLTATTAAHKGLGYHHVTWVTHTVVFFKERLFQASEITSCQVLLLHTQLQLHSPRNTRARAHTFVNAGGESASHDVIFLPPSVLIFRVLERNCTRFLVLSSWGQEKVFTCKHGAARAGRGFSHTCILAGSHLQKTHIKKNKNHSRMYSLLLPHTNISFLKTERTLETFINLN